MGTFQATEKAAEAPNIEEAMYDLILVRVDNKRVKGGQYTKDTVNGDPKLEWSFNLVNESGDVIVYDEEHEKAGEAVEVSKLTGVGFNIKAKTVPQEIRMLRALLTKAEFAAFEAGEATPDSDLPASKGGMLGRKAQGEVFVKENGWPGIGNVVAPRGGQKGVQA
jgi:hypothetical protein